MAGRSIHWSVRQIIWNNTRKTKARLGALDEKRLVIHTPTALLGFRQSSVTRDVRALAGVPIAPGDVAASIDRMRQGIDAEIVVA